MRQMIIFYCYYLCAYNNDWVTVGMLNFVLFLLLNVFHVKGKLFINLGWLFFHPLIKNEEEMSSKLLIRGQSQLPSMHWNQQAQTLFYLILLSYLFQCSSHVTRLINPLIQIFPGFYYFDDFSTSQHDLTNYVVTTSLSGKQNNPCMVIW